MLVHPLQPQRLGLNLDGLRSHAQPERLTLITKSDAQ